MGIGRTKSGTNHSDPRVSNGQFDSRYVPSHLERSAWNHGIITSIYEIFLSSLPQQPFSAAFLSLSQQLFSAAFLSSLSQPAAFLSHHLALVWGWWSAIAIILLWSGVGGKLFWSSCCGQGLVVSIARNTFLERNIGFAFGET